MVQNVHFAFVLDYFTEFVVEKLDCVVFACMFKFLHSGDFLSFVISVRHVVLEAN